MKSRTSYFNGGVLRKNLTRFSPAWGLYLVFGVLITVMAAADETAAWFAREIGYSMPFMAMVNACYGLIVALLLFGDLFSSRMCNALHAMPLRREGWFLTNLTAGFVFSLLPNAVITVVMLLFTSGYAHMALSWFALMCLQYLFFYGLAVFSIFCTGNRFAAALVFAILNFLAMLVYFLMDTLYSPLLYGIEVKDTMFSPFCPAVHMLSLEYFEDIWVFPEGATGDQLLEPETLLLQLLGSDFLYAIICAVIGVGLTVAALALYRRRNLEAAGDFIAVKPLAPVFLVLYALCAGAVVYLFFSLTIGTEGLVFLFIGLAIGYFTGKMLLGRTTRVFRGKSWLGFGILAGAVALSLALTALDPLGITRWVPDSDRVASVTYAESSYARYDDSAYGRYTATQPEEIEDFLSLHRYAVENPDSVHEVYHSDIRVYLKYTLKNGRQVYRNYSVPTDSEAGQIIREYTNTPEYVLHGYFSGFEEMLPYLKGVYSDAEIRPEHWAGLLAALEQDLQEGKLSPIWELHPDLDTVTWLELGFAHPENNRQKYLSLSIWTDAEHTFTFLRENDYLSEKYIDKVIYE